MMELVERYLQSVEAELSTPHKADIIRELRGNILDEIESGNTAKANADDQVTLVLIKHGHPAQVAQSFEPIAPLVASVDMPFYKTVLWSGAILVFLLALVKSLSVLISADSINPIRFLFIILGTFLDNIGIVVIGITLLFFYLGKQGVIQKWRYRNWLPKDLPKNPSVKTSISDSITDITTSLFLLLIVWIPLWMSQEVQQDLIFVLAQDKQYWRYVISVLCVLSIMHNLYRFTQHSWRKPSLAVYVLDNALFAIIFFAMASETTLFILNQDLAITMSADNPDRLRWAKAFLDAGVSGVLMVIGATAAGIAGYYGWLMTKLK
jgi:hypothetical protein